MVSDQLPESAQRVILHGSGETEIPFTYTNERGRKMVRRHPFEGVIPSLDRRLRETDSLVVRDELLALHYAARLRNGVARLFSPYL